MSVSKFASLIEQAELERETGAPEKALKLFLKILTNAQNSAQKSEITRHLGLCYEHLGYLTQSKEYYEDSYYYAEKARDNLDRARALRHQSSLEIKLGNEIPALSLARKAFDLLEKEQPRPLDAIWITHGLVKALIFAKRPRNEVCILVKIEANDLKYMWPRETNKVRKFVWLTGFLADVIYGWPVSSVILLPSILFIVASQNLKLRLKQLVSGKRF